MPLKGWIHPLTRAKVGLDHFNDDTSRRGRPAANPWMAAYGAAKAEGDIRHAGLDLTATRCLGCPRQVYIEAMFEYYMDPSSLELRTRGNGLHGVAAEWWPPETYVTEKSALEMIYAGTIGGLTYTCQVDCRRKDWTEIIDTKFPRDFSLKFRGEKAKDDHTAQLNLIRMAIACDDRAISEGYDPDEVLLTIWDHANAPREQSKPLPAEHWTEDRLLAHKPGGGEATVEEIIAVHAWMVETHASGPQESMVHREKVASALPMTGETQFRGQKCPLYCDVSDVCGDLVRRFGQPEGGFDG